MAWFGLSLAVGALLGLTGKARWFIVLIAGTTLLLGGAWLYVYYVTVLPNFGTGGGGNGTGIGFAYVSAFLFVTWVATLFAFCFGFLINAFLRWMDWL